MKTRLYSLIRRSAALLLVLFGLNASAAWAEACTVVFYPNTNFDGGGGTATGDSLSFTGPLDAIKSFHSSGFMGFIPSDWNDRISSFRFIGDCGGARIILYGDTKFRGPTVELTYESYPAVDLSGLNWNDETSSIKVLFPEDPNNTIGNWVSYATRYLDIQLVFGTNFDGMFEHYYRNGRGENRDPSKLADCVQGDTGGLPELADKPFDPCWYVSNHPDLLAVMPGDQYEAYRHWIDHGLAEGRQSNAGFSISAYRDRYPDLHGHSYRDALQHWQDNGQAGGRNAAPYEREFTTAWTLVEGHAIDIGAGADGSVWVIDDYNRQVYRYTESGWEDLGLSNSGRIDVGPDGTAWVVREDTRINYYDSTLEDWDLVEGHAIDIGVGANGHVWAISPEGKIYRRHANPADGWQDMDGTAGRIDVDHNGLAWVVQADGKIYNSHGVPGDWTAVPGRAADIGVGTDGDVWMTRKGDGAIHRWNADKADWDKTDGNAAQITVDQHGTPWVVQNNTTIWTVAE